MELTVKKFSELTVFELFEIYKLRSAVFVVEQKCIYQDIDDADKMAYHVFLKDGDGIQAYLRVLSAEHSGHGHVMIGRVIAAKRGCGLGRRIVAEGIIVAREKFGGEKIIVAAQTYAKGFYERSGFVRSSDEFVEDGIPHVMMTLDNK